MTKIGLISDTHGWLDEKVFGYFSACDEIWHAGDLGNYDIAQSLAGITSGRLRAVYGNIDGQDVRSVYPEKLRWRCEEVEIFMTHIGGYPGKYAPGIRNELMSRPTQLFVCGHSHILRVMYDEKLNCLHMNPGAAGRQGWQKVRTILRFSIDGKEIKDCEVIELKPR